MNTAASAAAILPRVHAATTCAECSFAGILSTSPAGGSWRCREHHYQLRGYRGMEGRRGNELPNPLISMSVRWGHKRLEKAKFDKANSELTALAKD